MKVIPYWLVWLILAGVFFIVEIFTAGFFMFWFGVGALFALIFWALKSPIWLQWIVFLIVSTIGAIFSRKFADKISKKEPEKLAHEDVLNYEGKVIDELKDDVEAVLGKFKGDTWRCIPEDSNVKLKVGDIIKPIKIEGTHLIVKKIEKEEEK